MEKRFISPKELSQYLGLAEQTIYHWVYQRKINHYKLGRLVKFDVREIDKYVNSLRVKGLENDLKI